MPHSLRKGLLVLLYLGLITCLGTFASPAAAAPPPGAGSHNDKIGPFCQMGGMMGGRGYCGPMGGAGGQPGLPGPGSGADLFRQNCAGCHPGGGNTLVPNLPIRGSAQLRDFDTFRTYVRYPSMPNGAPGAMPAFSASRLSYPQLLELYRYLKSRWGG
jgi:hypothetical protein